ncbi:MAG TPA: tetratricopeptide repeat protein [Methanoregulaceae archaeon]|nr:tetratricopeptide repeat protein [Methanoregulaceae archaeon]
MMPVNGKNVSIEAQILYRKAKELSGQGKYETALRFLKGVVTVAPGFSKAFNEMGNCLSRLGRYEEAVMKYEKALRIEPSCREAHENLAMVQAKLIQTGHEGGQTHHTPETISNIQKSLFSLPEFSDPEAYRRIVIFATTSPAARPGVNQVHICHV